MNKKPKKIIIGLSGVARSGKDTFCLHLLNSFKKRGYNAKRFALADQLKIDIRDFLIEKFNIDILNCSPADKEIVRGILVGYGRAMRLKSEGTYWTSLIQEQIEQDDCEVAIITDVRYDEFEKDEVFWVKKVMDGSLIHVRRYEKVMLSSFYPAPSLERHYISPPNSDEASNDPRVRSKADYKLEWETFAGEEPYKEDGKCAKFVEEFLDNEFKLFAFQR